MNVAEIADADESSESGGSRGVRRPRDGSDHQEQQDQQPPAKRPAAPSDEEIRKINEKLDLYLHHGPKSRDFFSGMFKMMGPDFQEEHFAVVGGIIGVSPDVIKHWKKKLEAQMVPEPLPIPPPSIDRSLPAIPLSTLQDQEEAARARARVEARAILAQIRAEEAQALAENRDAPALAQPFQDQAQAYRMIAAHVQARAILAEARAAEAQVLAENQDVHRAPVPQPPALPQAAARPRIPAAVPARAPVAPVQRLVPPPPPIQVLAPIPAHVIDGPARLAGRLPPPPPLLPFARVAAPIPAYLRDRRLPPPPPAPVAPRPADPELDQRILQILRFLRTLGLSDAAIEAAREELGQILVRRRI